MFPLQGSLRFPLEPEAIKSYILDLKWPVLILMELLHASQMEGSG